MQHGTKIENHFLMLRFHNASNGTFSTGSSLIIFIWCIRKTSDGKALSPMLSRGVIESSRYKAKLELDSINKLELEFDSKLIKFFFYMFETRLEK